MSHRFEIAGTTEVFGVLCSVGKAITLSDRQLSHPSVQELIRRGILRETPVTLEPTKIQVSLEVSPKETLLESYEDLESKSLGDLKILARDLGLDDTGRKKTTLINRIRELEEN